MYKKNNVHEKKLIMYLKHVNRVFKMLILYYQNVILYYKNVQYAFRKCSSCIIKCSSYIRNYKMNIKYSLCFWNLFFDILHKCSMCIRKLFNVYYKCSMHICKLFNTYIHSFPKMFIVYNLKCSLYIKKMFNGYYKIISAKYLQMFKSSSIHNVSRRESICWTH